MPTLEEADFSREGPSLEQDEAYWVLYNRQKEELEDLANSYLDGSISLDELVSGLRASALDYYTALALLGAGSEDEISSRQDELSDFTDQLVAQIETYREDIESSDFSDDYIRWRTRIFSNARQIYVWFSVPAFIAARLEAFPAIVCLGNGRCGCFLQWEFFEEESVVLVYWIINPFKDSCEVCIRFADAWSPLEVEVS